MGEKDAKVTHQRVQTLHEALDKMFVDAKDLGIEVISEKDPTGDIVRRIRHNGLVAEERTTNLGNVTFTIFDTAILPNNEREKYIIEEEATGQIIPQSDKQQILYFVTSYRRRVGGKMEPSQAGAAASYEMRSAIKGTRFQLGLRRY